MRSSLAAVKTLATTTLLLVVVGLAVASTTWLSASGCQRLACYQNSDGKVVCLCY